MLRALDQLLPEVRCYDEAALSAVYQTMSPRLYHYAYRLLGDRQEAEEITAEAFHRLLVSLQHGGGPRDHLAAYLYRITHNLITDRYRRRVPVEVALDGRLPASNLAEPAEATARAMAQADVRQALACLTPDQRLVISLRYFEGFSPEEAAALVGKPVGAVKSLQHRGLEALRRLLRPSDEEVFDEIVA